MTTDIRNAEILKAERVTTGSGDSMRSKYLVFTDKGVFENTDTIFYGKWNSSDFYARMNMGDVCNFTVTGWRVPFLSWYQNIVEMDCRKGEQ